MAIPQNAVAGLSYCGEWSDSPANGKACRAELDALRRYLRNAKIIGGRFVRGDQIATFAVKIWLVYPANVYNRARELAETWLAEHRAETRLLHDARP